MPSETEMERARVGVSEREREQKVVGSIKGYVYDVRQACNQIPIEPDNTLEFSSELTLST